MAPHAMRLDGTARGGRCWRFLGIGMSTQNGMLVRLYVPIISVILFTPYPSFTSTAVRACPVTGMREPSSGMLALSMLRELDSQQARDHVHLAHVLKRMRQPKVH